MSRHINLFKEEFNSVPRRCYKCHFEGCVLSDYNPKKDDIDIINSKRPWTKEDDENLADLVVTDACYHSICNILDRTIEDIDDRIDLLNLDLFHEINNENIFD